MQHILLVAATERELDGREGSSAASGPSRRGRDRPCARAPQLRAVLHIGVAGGRDLASGTIVIGAEAVYCDLAAASSARRSGRGGPGVSSLRRAGDSPDAPVLPIGTSAAVGGAGRDLAVEAMEGFGVLRAAALAGVPADRDPRDLERDRRGRPRPAGRSRRRSTRSRA